MNIDNHHSWCAANKSGADLSECDCQDNPIIKAISNPHRKELPGNPDPLEVAASAKIVARYTEAYEDGLRDWEKDHTQSLFECIHRRTRETF